MKYPSAIPLRTHLQAVIIRSTTEANDSRLAHDWYCEVAGNMPGFGACKFRSHRRKFHSYLFDAYIAIETLPA